VEYYETVFEAVCVTVLHVWYRHMTRDD